MSGERIEDRELAELLEKKARELMKKCATGTQQEVFVKKVVADCPHGIYVYDREKSGWRLIRTEGKHFEVGELGDGVYVIYFDNTKCPACRKYDLYWYPFMETTAKTLDGYYFVIILCEWFAGKCRSPAAAATFKHYKVVASPTTLLAYVVDGKTIYTEKYEGVLTLEELLKVVPSFKERGERARRGEKVEPPLKDKVSKDELLELLKKLLGLRL